MRNTLNRKTGGVERGREGMGEKTVTFSNLCVHVRIWRQKQHTSLRKGLQTLVCPRLPAWKESHLPRPRSRAPTRGRPHLQIAEKLPPGTFKNLWKVGLPGLLAKHPQPPYHLLVFFLLPSSVQRAQSWMRPWVGRWGEVSEAETPRWAPSTPRGNGNHLLRSFTGFSVSQFL